MRSAEVADAEALSLVGSATFLDAYAGWLDGPDIVAHARGQHAPDYYARQLGPGGRAAAWLAEADPGGAPIGYALLIESPELPAETVRPGDVELKRIYALSRYHGPDGPAAALMTAAATEAKRRGARRLLLATHPENERSMRFYAKHGFELIGRRAFQVGDAVFDDVVLARLL